MSIDVPVLEVLDLAVRIRAAAEPAHDARARLQPAGRAGDIAGALAGALDAFRLVAGALAVETEELSSAVDAMARSWVALDEGLLARRGQVLAR